MKPTPSTSILDVGASGISSHGGEVVNFLEEWYPHPESITAIGVTDLSPLKRSLPSITAVRGDGRRLPFRDKSFDIVFSNATVEHVGDASAQRRFVDECLRVGRAVFITTPAREFPVEAHTMVPLAHYLPLAIRNRIYRVLGRRREATPGALTLLYRRELRSLFPPERGVRIVTTRLFGVPANHIAIHTDR